MNRRVVIVVALVALVLVAGGVTWGLRRNHTPGVFIGPVEVRAPDGTRIRVQVLNSTKVHGLARRATLLLRDRGFDVVETGTVSGARDSTVVLDLSGHPEWAARVATILGRARVETRPDSSRYLDIAVVLGSAWRPPAKPFYP
jgi:hypothetical protein